MSTSTSLQRLLRLVGAAILAIVVAACTTEPSSSHPPASVFEHPPEPADTPLSGTSLAEAEAARRADLQFIYVPASGFAYRGEDGRPTGATVELLRDFADWLARDRGIAAHVHWLEQEDWSRFYAQVSEGQGAVFGVGNVTITEAREDELDFSPPYMRNVAVLVTHEREPELVSMDTLGEAFAGMRALAFPGTLHETRLHELSTRHFEGRLPMDALGSNDAIVERLSGTARGFAYLDAYNLHRAQQAGKPLRRHAVGDDASESFGVILPDDSDWTPLIRAFFEADGGYVNSPRWREHLSNHLGPELATVLLD